MYGTVLTGLVILLATSPIAISPGEHIAMTRGTSMATAARENREALNIIFVGRNSVSLTALKLTVYKPAVLKGAARLALPGLMRIRKRASFQPTSTCSFTAVAHSRA